jgi:hypothetical protein
MIEGNGVVLKWRVEVGLGEMPRISGIGKKTEVGELELVRHHSSRFQGFAVARHPPAPINEKEAEEGEGNGPEDEEGIGLSHLVETLQVIGSDCVDLKEKVPSVFAGVLHSVFSYLLHNRVLHSSISSSSSGEQISKYIRFFTTTWYHNHRSSGILAHSASGNSSDLSPLTVKPHMI